MKIDFVFNILQSICLFHKHFLDVITNLKGKNDKKLIQRIVAFEHFCKGVKNHPL